MISTFKHRHNTAPAGEPIAEPTPPADLSPRDRRDRDAETLDERLVRLANAAKAAQAALATADEEVTAATRAFGSPDLDVHDRAEAMRRIERAERSAKFARLAHQEADRRVDELKRKLGNPSTRAKVERLEKVRQNATPAALTQRAREQLGPLARAALDALVALDAAKAALLADAHVRRREAQELARDLDLSIIVADVDAWSPRREIAIAVEEGCRARGVDAGIFQIMNPNAKDVG